VTEGANSANAGRGDRGAHFFKTGGILIAKLAVMTTTVQPRLIVADVDAAVAFYQKIFGAEETFRYTEPGSVAHCVLRIDASELSLAQANNNYALYDPESVGGSPVLVKAIVEDAKGVGAAMVAADASVIVPIEDRGYGKCEGRIRDPFGHLWVISRDL
jgi:PhnB protein